MCAVIFHCIPFAGSNEDAADSADGAGEKTPPMVRKHVRQNPIVKFASQCRSVGVCLYVCVSVWCGVCINFFVFFCFTHQLTCAPTFLALWWQVQEVMPTGDGALIAALEQMDADGMQEKLKALERLNHTLQLEEEKQRKAGMVLTMYSEP